MKKLLCTLLFIVFITFCSSVPSAQAITKSTIKVKNVGESTAYVKVSKACGTGQDGYWKIKPGDSETWKRCISKRVNIKASESRNDSDIFAAVEHTTNLSSGCNRYDVWNEELEFKPEAGLCDGISVPIIW